MIVTLIEALPVPTAFVAETATENAPAAVGVPLIPPVAAFKVRPGGSPLAAKAVA